MQMDWNVGALRRIGLVVCALGGCLLGWLSAGPLGSPRGGALAFHWIVFLALIFGLVYTGRHAYRWPRAWTVWLLTSDGLLMLVVAAIVSWQPTLGRADTHAALYAVGSGVLWLFAGALSLVRGRPRT